MSKDYKPRTKDRYADPRKRESTRRAGVSFWRWMLITGITISFVVFLVYLKTTGKSKDASNKSNEAAQTAEKPEVNPQPKEPQFDFYTLLPKKEVEVPEYEIKTRTREERVGKAKESHYMMQVGSFKSFNEADQMRKKLASLGMESKVQKAKVGKVNWYRVKMGPFTQTSSVNANKTRLKQNGIDVVITEASE